MLEYFARVVLPKMNPSITVSSGWTPEFQTSRLKNLKRNILKSSLKKVAMRWRQWQVCAVEYFKKCNCIPRKMHGTITNCMATPAIASKQSCTQGLCLCNCVWVEHRRARHLSKTRNTPSPRQLVFNFVFTILTNISFIWRTWRQTSQNSYFNFIYIHTHAAIHSQYRRQTKDRWHNFFGEIFFFTLYHRSDFCLFHGL